MNEVKERDERNEFDEEERIENKKYIESNLQYSQEGGRRGAQHVSARPKVVSVLYWSYKEDTYIKGSMILLNYVWWDYIDVHTASILATMVSDCSTFYEDGKQVRNRRCNSILN